MSILSEITDLTGLVHSLFPHATGGRDKWLRCGDAYGNGGTSFRISTESGIWFDHNGGESGDVVDVIMLREGLDHAGAAAWLRQYGWMEQKELKQTAPANFFRPRPEHRYPKGGPAWLDDPQPLTFAPATTPMPRAQDVLERARYSVGFQCRKKFVGAELIEQLEEKLADIQPTGPATHFAYRNAAGEIGLVVTRWPSRSRKQVRRSYWNGKKWIGKGPDQIEKVPLYNLPLHTARINDNEVHGLDVYVVEGEKAADACLSVLDAHAVCPLGGSSPHAGTDWEPLAGFDVLILGDADVAGKKFTQRVSAAVSGIAASVTHVNPQVIWDRLGGVGEVPKGWDIADPVPDTLFNVKPTPPVSPTQAAETAVLNSPDAAISPEGVAYATFQEMHDAALAAFPNSITVAVQTKEQAGDQAEAQTETPDTDHIWTEGDKLW